MFGYILRRGCITAYECECTATVVPLLCTLYFIDAMQGPGAEVLGLTLVSGRAR